MWYYNGMPFETAPEDYLGFVYLITEKSTGKKYIGKKLFWAASSRMVKGKKKKVRKESNWKAYYGSSNALQERLDELGPDGYNREILHLCKAKGELNYRELKEQIERDVLLRDDYYNGIINIRLNRSAVKGLK